MSLLPAEFLKNTAIHHIHDLPKKWLWFYIIILAIIISSICALPYFYIPISISTTGFIRPAQERSVIKSSITAIIDSIFCAEGSFVTQNQTIFTLQNYHIQQKLECKKLCFFGFRMCFFAFVKKNITKNLVVSKKLLSCRKYFYDTRHSTFDTRHSTFDIRHTALDTRQSTIGTRQSTKSYQFYKVG